GQQFGQLRGRIGVRVEPAVLPVGRDVGLGERGHRGLQDLFLGLGPAGCGHRCSPPSGLPGNCSSNTLSYTSDNSRTSARDTPENRICFLDDLASSLLTGSLGKATFSARNGGRAEGRAFPRAGAPLGR